MIQKIKNYFFPKWKTVNVIKEDGLKVHVYSIFHGESKEDACIKVQLKIKNNVAYKIRCLISTGFESEVVDVDYVMSLFDLHSHKELIYYKNPLLELTMPNLALS